MTTKKAIKKLIKIATALGFEYIRNSKHGSVYRHPTHTYIDEYGVEKPQTINIGGTPSDSNFHRQAVRELRKYGYTVPYLNG